MLEVCERYGIEQRKAEPVRQHVVRLFDALTGVHQLPHEYKLWLEAAAMMEEVGKFMNHQGHFRHTQYIIANSEIFGFSPEQRQIVSAIARYMGKTQPDPMDRVMRAIPVEEHKHVARAVVLLRLAMALNQDRASAVVRLRTTVYPKRVVLDLVPGRGGAELEAWSFEARGPLTSARSFLRRALRRGGIERADDAGIEHSLQGGGGAGEVQAWRAFLCAAGSEPEPSRPGRACFRERRSGWIMADDQQVFNVAAIQQQLLEVLETGLGGHRGRLQDGRFVPGLGGR